MGDHSHANVQLFLNGKPVTGVEEVHDHVSPTSVYLKVLGTLFVLTALTYAVSFADLGPASLPVAMIVAFAKATLVCMYFMHLKYDDRFHVFVFMSTLIFVAIFFTITIFDLVSRPRLNEEQETFFRIQHEQNWNEALRVEPAPAGGAHGEEAAPQGEEGQPAH